MPAWWSKKSSTNNSSSSKVRQEKRSSSDRSPAAAGAASNNSIPASNSKSNRTSNHQNRSFDEVCFAHGASPRNSREFVIGSSEGTGLGLPLPRPSPSNLSNFSASAVIDHGVSGYGSGSVSVSSVSSSGSSDDNNNSILTFNEQSQFGLSRGQSETNFNIRPRSPGPSFRAPTTSTSPLHPRHSSTSLESPTGKQEEGNSHAHPLPLPLPLPPGSPTSPSSSSNKRINGVCESTSNMLSKWRKGKLLGRGSFGHVYVGFNSENGQMCAIKEVKVVSDDRSSKESLKQLNQEINLLSQLSHPNIVQYIGSELNEDTLSVYLEYVSGGSIHKLLQEYGPFKEPVIQNYTRQILSGLAYLHGRNTVHRDVKGANILVDPNGEIKLADFGMAKHITSASSMLSFKGSPYWMAPEVVMNTSGYSLAVDIWSLGCTILEMATAKPPWSQFEGVAAIFKIGNSKDMPDIPEHLSNDAKDFVKLCLRRDPSMRPSAIQLLDHPFIQDQATPRAANINMTRDVFSYTFDGSRTPPPAALDLHSNGSAMRSFDADFAVRPGFRSARAVRSPRDSTRIITSLPVSPSSSPLRQHMMPFKSTLPSPVHPALSVGGQGGINFNNYSSYTRPNTTYPLDPWQDTPLFRSQTPSGSPRSRPI